MKLPIPPNSYVQTHIIHQNDTWNIIVKGDNPNVRLLNYKNKLKEIPLDLRGIDNFTFMSFLQIGHEVYMSLEDNDADIQYFSITSPFLLQYQILTLISCLPHKRYYNNPKITYGDFNFLYLLNRINENISTNQKYVTIFNPQPESINYKQIEFPGNISSATLSKNESEIGVIYIKEGQYYFTIEKNPYNGN